ncbi:hypothetical protein EON81_27970 [bacterium]|nr:MAG: hypothetical protein EON81_27970 [bacterium]
MRDKLYAAIGQAAAILEARPDPALAKVARKASLVNAVGDDQACAIAFSYVRDGKKELTSWPGIGHFQGESRIWSAEEFAQKFVDVLDDIDARTPIDR